MTFSANVLRIGRTRLETDEPTATGDLGPVRKLVRQATTHASDSKETEDKEVENVDIRPQRMTFAFDMFGLPRTAVGDI